MAIINCTPHPINVINEDGSSVYIERSGMVIRLPTFIETEEPLEHEGQMVSTFSIQYGDFGMLPPEREGTYYVVSSFAAESIVDRTDILAPGRAWKNEHGEIVGCRGLRRV